MLQQTIAVFLVLSLLLVTLWLLKRKGLTTLHFAAGLARFRGRGREPRMRVLERVVLTPQHSLHLVSIENKLVVFAASPGGCQAVDRTLWNFEGEPVPVRKLEKTVASC